MFRVPTVKQCCCFDVRFGSLVIACLELAYAVVGLLDGVRLAAANVGPSVLTIEATTTSPDGDSDDFPAFVLRDKSVVKRLARMYFWFHLAETIGMLVIASLLVHGIRTKRRSLFMPWLGIHFLTTVIFGVLVIVVPLGAVAEFGNQMAGAGAAAGIACLIAFVINAYITTVVYSHYRELGADARARHQLARPMEVEVYLAEQLPPSYEEIVKNKEAYPPVAVSTNP